MKRKFLGALGIFLTAGMLVSSNGVVAAVELKSDQSGAGTYYSEEASQAESTESDASVGQESGKVTEPGESTPVPSEESKESTEAKPSESTPASSEESKESTEGKPSESTPAPSGESKENTEGKPGESTPVLPEESKESTEGKPGESVPAPSEESKENTEAKPSEGVSASPEGSKEGTEAKPGVAEGESKAPEADASTEEITDGWKEEDGKFYWYEGGVKQGTEGFGKEVYDPEAEAWYWLDSADNGARAEGKEVYLEADGGKWVRYDEDGRRVEGEYTFEEQDYYYEPVTGAMVKGPMVLPDGRRVFYDLENGQMVKGEYEVNGTVYHFDETDGHLAEEAEPEFWLTIEGHSYWYVGWVRQGWKPEDAEYAGEEIYDAASEAWFWLDGTAQGRAAADEIVYLKDGLADDAGNLGKWVYYEENGHMLRGWSEDGMRYGDPVYGNMATGLVVIGNKQYEFDVATGLKLSEQVISGFELYGLAENVEAGVEYDYETSCCDVEALKATGKATFYYQAFESDETHAAREGYEWRQAAVSMVYDSISAQYFGYQYAVLVGLDYYTFQNDALIEDADAEGALERGEVINIEGKDYDILTRYEVLENGWGEDGIARVTILYECQVPVGYDGKVIALYNAANVDKGELALDRLDEDSLIFRMK